MATLTPELAELVVLNTFDWERGLLGHDYGNGQRGSELIRRRRELERSEAAIDLYALVRDLRDDEANLPILRAAFERVGRPRFRRILGEDYRRRTPATKRTLNAWAIVASQVGVAL